VKDTEAAFSPAGLCEEVLVAAPAPPCMPACLLLIAAVSIPVQAYDTDKR